MASAKILVFLAAAALLSVSASALSFNELGVEPGNQLYLDDSFSVTASFNGNSCDWKIRFYMDGKPFNLTGLYNGTKPLKCGMSEVETSKWDLTVKPLSPGAHVLRIELIEPLNVVFEDSTQIVRVFDLKRPRDTTSTTKQLPTTRRTTTSVATIPVTTTTLPVQYLDYVNGGYGFMLSYPSSWEVKEKASGTVVSFFAPKDAGVLPDIFSENFSVSVVETDGTLDSFVQSARDALAAESGVKVTGESEVEVLGEGGRQLNLEYSDGPIRFRAHRIYFKRNSLIYVLAFDAEDMQYSRYLSIFNRMKNSFAITVAQTTSSTTTTSTSTTSTTQAPSIIPRVDWSAALLIVLVAVVLFIAYVAKGRPKAKKPPAPPKPLRPTQPPARVAGASEERVKGEVMRKTAAVVSEKARIDEVEDPAFERLKKIKALEKEVEEVVRQEKEADARPRKPPSGGA